MSMTNVTIMVLIAVTAYVVCDFRAPGAVALVVLATYLVDTVVLAATGATPGLLLFSARLRRATSPHTPPGWAGAHRNLLVLISALATAGVGPLVIYLTALVRHEKRNWFDRMSGTVLLRSSPTTYGTASILCDGDLIAVFGPTVVGRQPAPPSRVPHARLVAVTTPDPSISKTHVLILPDPAGVMLTDLDSTNGTHVETETGTHRLRPGRTELVRRGYRFYLGDTICTVQ